MIRVATLLGCVLLAAAGTETIPDDNCTSGIFFNRQYYDKEVLKTDILNADDFSYVNGTNTLFFSYTLPENSSEYFAIAYLNLDNKEFSGIPGISSGSTTAVDTDTGDVYFGGDSGVYKFNPESKSAEFVTAEDVNIWALYYYKEIFYITFPEYKLYDSKGDQSFESSITVSRIIGNESEYFLVNSTGLYRVTDDNEDTAELFGELDQFYKGVSKDANENTYVFDTESVYVPNRKKKSLDKVAEIESLHGLAFDRNNNIIYSNDNSIVRLTPSRLSCPSPA